MYNWSYGAFYVLRKRSCFRLAWSRHAPIEINKLNWQVHSAQQQFSTKLHPDRSTFRRIAAENLEIENGHAYGACPLISDGNDEDAST